MSIKWGGCKTIFWSVLFHHVCMGRAFFVRLLSLYRMRFCKITMPSYPSSFSSTLYTSQNLFPFLFFLSLWTRKLTLSNLCLLRVAIQRLVMWLGKCNYTCSTIVLLVLLQYIHIFLKWCALIFSLHYLQWFPKHY